MIMFLSFFLCQFLSASDEQRPEQNLTVQQRIKIHEYALNCLDDKDSLLDYFRYKWTDVLTRGKGFLWVSEKLPSVEFQDFIDTAIKNVCQNEDLKHHTDRLRDFLKEPSLFKNSVQTARDQIRSEKIALQKTRMKRFANWLGSYVLLRNRFSNIYMKKTNVNEQAAEDLRLLELIIQLEHVISTDGLDEEKDDNKELYLFKIRQMLHNSITATAPWLEKWQAHIEHNHPYIKKMSDWSDIKERIQQHPQIDFVRMYDYVIYEVAVVLGTMFCLALCSYQIYHYGFYAFWTNLLGIFGAAYTTENNTAFTTPPPVQNVIETTAPVMQAVVPVLHRHMETLGMDADFLDNLTSVIQNCSKALGAFAQDSGSMPCDQRSQWLSNIFRGVDTKDGWAICTMFLAPAIRNIACQELLTGTDQYTAYLAMTIVPQYKKR
jgi:hypothetical protein